MVVKGMVVKGSMELMDEVVDTGLCAFCGACTGACPYRVTYKGRVVLLDNCTISDGQCYTYCPRTYTDMDAMSKKIFGVPYSEDEIGTAREIFLARSTDAKVHEKGQDGGQSPQSGPAHHAHQHGFRLIFERVSCCDKTAF